MGIYKFIKNFSFKCKPFLACSRHGRCWKHSEWEPCYGVFAYCGAGMLGLITSNEPEEVHYADGTTGMAWTGIHLSAGHEGELWCSRKPYVVGSVWEFKSKFDKRITMCKIHEKTLKNR